MVEKEIQNLIYELIDKTISPQDFDRLQDAIKDDPEVRDEYVRAVSVCELLADPLSFEHGTIVSGENAVAMLKRRKTFWQSPEFAYFAAFIAASLLAVFAIHQSLRSTHSESQVVQIRTPTKQGLARIVRRVDCVLENERWGIPAPGFFEAGQSIAVAEGLISVEFNDGAVVTLQGPADLEILSSNSGFLHLGSLTAIVPPQAIGFEVLTPSTRVVDHGTEFGVAVDEDGNTETHVFKGEVELAPTTSSEGNDLEEKPASSSATSGLQLHESMAARVEGKPSLANEFNPESITANPKQFVRIPSESDSAVSPANVTNLPNRGGLVMWFEASQGVQLDFEDHVVSWVNLAQRDADDQRASAAAWQVAPERRPTWKSDSFGAARNDGEKSPSIHFSGRKDQQFLVTSPVETGDDATLFVVCSVSQQQPSTIFGLEGKVKLKVRHFTHSLNAQALTLTSIPRFQRNMISGIGLAVEEPVLLSVRYGQHENVFELYVNGDLQQSGEPLGSLSANASHLIGAGKGRKPQHFKGSIAEIAVYDCLMSLDEFNDAEDTLMSKYGITSIR